jgi:hypothetical protein
MVLVRLRVFRDPTCTVASRREGDVLTISLPEWVELRPPLGAWCHGPIILPSGETCIQYSWLTKVN